MRIIVQIFIVILSGLFYIGAVSAEAGTAADYSDCGSLANRYGPYDYQDLAIRAEKWEIVHMAHFTPEVENLVKGRSGTLASDIDYTLRAFPNNPRALYAMVRYQLQKNRAPMRYTADCYFQRAIKFRPNDGIVRLVYGIYLHKIRKYEKALEQYILSLKLKPKNADTFYNIGLVYLDMKKYKKAHEYAIKAYELNHPLQGLKNQLRDKGIWEDKKSEKTSDKKTRQSNKPTTTK